MFQPSRFSLAALAISAVLGAAILGPLPSAFAGGGGAAAVGGAGAGRGGGPGGFGGARGGGARGPLPQAGPPAPVPAEVAIPRPSAEELSKMNADVKGFIDSGASPDKDLLQKYSALFAAQLPRDNPCIRPIGGGVRGPRHAAFIETANTGDFDLLFEGDSITDWWIQNAKPTAAYTKYFGNIKTADFAVAGDTTQGVLWGLQNGEGQGHKPKAIMLMIGTNNLGQDNIRGNSPAEIAEGIGAIILENRKDFPDAKILLLAVFPRGLPNDGARPRIVEINKIISKLDDGNHIFYMDIGSKFLDPETHAFLPDAFRGDNLHPQEKGI